MSRELVDALCHRFLLSSSFDIEPVDQERIVKWLVPEIERLLAEEQEKVREMCAAYVERHWVYGKGTEAEPYVIKSYSVPRQDLVQLGNAIRQLDLTALGDKEGK